MSNWVIRKMDVSDVRYVDRMDQVYFGKSLSEKMLSNELLYNDLAHYFIAVTEGERIGYVGVWITEPNAEITNILIIDKWRHKGLGRALLNCVFDLCRKRDVQALTLEVRVSNHDAIAFYKAMGFIISATRKKYYENGEDAYLMMMQIGGEQK